MKYNRYIILTLFALTCVAQWYVLTRWMSKSEYTRSHGTYIKIPCTQVDPIDPFRGTYLNINPTLGQIQFFDSARFTNGQDIWMNYTCDDSSRCQYQTAQPVYETPAESTYIRCQIQSIYPSFNEGDTIKNYSGHIIYPFTKYYINEKAAPALAEKYNKAVADTSVRVYAGMYVFNGDAVLDAIWIGNEKLQ